MPKLKAETLAARKSYILKSAMVCFARSGYHQTTMDDIVRETGLSKGGLYVHFNSKHELFLAMVDGFVEEFRLFSIPEANSSSALDRLTTILDDMVKTASSPDFREISTLMTHVWALNVHEPEVNHLITRLYAQVRQPLAALLESGIAERTFNPVDATAMANIIIAVFEGLIIQAMIEAEAVDWHFASRTFKAMVTGLLSNPQARLSFNE